MREGCNQGGVNCNLGPVPEREAVCYDLNPAHVMPEGLDIEVPDQDMLLNGAAHTGSCPFKRPATGAKHARARAASYMVSQDVETPSAAASCSSKGQRHAQTPEGQSTEKGRGKTLARLGRL